MFGLWILVPPGRRLRKSPLIVLCRQNRNSDIQAEPIQDHLPAAVLKLDHILPGRSEKDISAVDVGADMRKPSFTKGCFQLRHGYLILSANINTPQQRDVKLHLFTFPSCSQILLLRTVPLSAAPQHSSESFPSVFCPGGKAGPETSVCTEDRSNESSLWPNAREFLLSSPPDTAVLRFPKGDVSFV